MTKTNAPTMKDVAKEAEFHLAPFLKLLTELLCARNIKRKWKLPLPASTMK